MDPEGSITVVDLSTGVTTPKLVTATYTACNQATLDSSIRIFGHNATVAQDLEPESIAISADSSTAYVTLQENNVMATVDIATATVTALVGLGLKDFSQPGFGLDPSDQDGGIHIGKGSQKLNGGEERFESWWAFGRDAWSAAAVEGQNGMAFSPSQGKLGP